jgi:hypothetical protein
MPGCVLTHSRTTDLGCCSGVGVTACCGSFSSMLSEKQWMEAASDKARHCFCAVQNAADYFLSQSNFYDDVPVSLVSGFGNILENLKYE